MPRPLHNPGANKFSRQNYTGKRSCDLHSASIGDPDFTTALLNSFLLMLCSMYVCSMYVCVNEFVVFYVCVC